MRNQTTKPTPAADFMAWLKAQFKTRNFTDATRKGHLTAIKALERFGQIKTFADLTLENIQAFDQFLREEKNFTSTGRPIHRSQAALHNYHKRIKSYVHQAYLEGIILTNPYDWFHDDKGELEGHHHLNIQQVRQLIELRQYANSLESQHYLDFFLFQLYTGLSYCDAKAFDYAKNIITIDGKPCINGMQLHTGRKYVIPILPYCWKILERNNFKMKIFSNQKYNQYLKGIGIALRCDFPLTTEVARHTFDYLIKQV